MPAHLSATLVSLLFNMPAHLSATLVSLLFNNAHCKLYAGASWPYGPWLM